MIQFKTNDRQTKTCSVYLIFDICRKNANVLLRLAEIAEYCVKCTGFFQTGPALHCNGIRPHPRFVYIFIVSTTGETLFQNFVFVCLGSYTKGTKNILFFIFMKLNEETLETLTALESHIIPLSSFCKPFFL